MSDNPKPSFDVTAVLAIIIVTGGGLAIAVGHSDNPVFQTAIGMVLGYYFGHAVGRSGV